MRLETDWREFDDPERIDVWSFKAAERLAIHEARTLADVGSGVVRHAQQVAGQSGRDLRGRVAAVSVAPAQT